MHSAGSIDLRAHELAGRDAFVLACNDALRLTNYLPEPWSHRYWDAVITVQDWRYLSLVRWHTLRRSAGLAFD